MVKKILETFKTDVELEAYLQAQQQSLIELSKKMNELQQENDNLRKQSQKFNAELNSERTLYLKDQEYKDSEIICINQIERFRILAEERTLTLEEAKNLDLMVKILDQVRSGDQSGDISKDVPTEDLLKLVKIGDDSGSY